ncbi:MAG TPA: hypothetical protein VHZ09_15115 [Acidobacteriaceae bacterium]|nr:hypothetical protein [Acidobacteriaceae bacterium]
MAKEHDDRPRGSHRADERHEARREEPYDDPKEHRNIEKRRFHGGLAPTPELYARAREQWYKLPGSVVRPSMDPVVGESEAGKQDPPGEEQPGKKGTER